MRAVYIPGIEFTDDELLKVDGDAAHHLVKVCRIKSSEALLVLNGLGDSAKCSIVSISKKIVELNVEKISTSKRKHYIDLAICPPKKDAYSDIVKYSVELGIGSLTPVRSEYSQKNVLKEDRINSLIESALIQSNNPFALNVEKEVPFSDLLNITKTYDQVFYFSSVTESKTSSDWSSDKRTLVIIGPEGGLSPDEEKTLLLNERIQVHQLPSWILRSQTALCSCVGFIFGLGN